MYYRDCTGEFHLSVHYYYYYCCCCCCCCCYYYYYYSPISEGIIEAV